MDLVRKDDRPVGEILREVAKVKDEEVARAAQVAQATGKRIGEVLEKAGAITPEEKQRSLGKQWGIPFVDLRDYAFSEKAIKSVPDYLLKEHKVITSSWRSPTP